MVLPLSNQNGKKVDWWFAYKLPMNVGPKSDSTGFEFLYCDSENDKNLSMSPIDLEHDDSAIGLSLGQIFGKDTDVGYVMWNDEIPPTKENPEPKDNGLKGHSKGILAFSKKTNSGFYLLHSTPRFPRVGEIELPENEKSYGQTYMCVGLKDYKTANDIAEILMTQNQGQVYSSHLPNVDKDEAISKFALNVKVETPSEPIDYHFETPNGIKFQLIAKNRHWSTAKKGEEVGKDFWEDLVCPTLKCDFSVETWRRGLVFSDDEAKLKETTLDVLDIDLAGIGLKGYQWAFTKDHAKWGVSEKKEDAMIVIADINRQTSQAKRGGGGLAFSNSSLWTALRSIEKVEKEIEHGVHKDTP